MQREHGVEIEWVMFPLHTDTPPGGRSLEELFASRPGYLDAARDRLSEAMEEEGLEYGDVDMIYNTRLAQELAKWAETQRGGDRIHDALFRAALIDNIALDEPERLIALADSIGLAADGARQALDSRAFQPMVDADWRRALALGIRSVPTFVFGNRGVAGAQPYEVLEALLESELHGAPEGLPVA